MNLRRRRDLILSFTAAALFAMMIYQIASRVLFPWDYYIWSESPFLTNLWKIDRGAPIFGDPKDANSWAYSPGLEHICYFLLKPFDLQLNVGACRIINLMIAAVGAAAAAMSCAAAARPGGKLTKGFVIFTSCAWLLLQNRSFTFDVCHPDNLHAAHAAAAFYLCYHAIRRGGFLLSCAAVGFAALGVHAKQTAAFGALGFLIVLILFQRARWGTVKTALFALIALAAQAASILPLALNANARFYTWELLNTQQRDLGKLSSLFVDSLQYPPYALVVAVAIPCALTMAASRSRMQQIYFWCWAAAGFEALPSIAAYCKSMGSWNNLSVIASWCFLVIVPALYKFTEAAFRYDRRRRAAALVGLQFILLIACFPSKLAPTGEQRRWASSIEEGVRRDVSNGKRVLLTHGTAALLRGGVTTIPMDRATSVLELVAAGRSKLAGTEERIQSKYYDRIYQFDLWYGPEITDLLHKHYKNVGEIAADPRAPFVDPLFCGFHGYASSAVQIFEPR